MNNLNWLVPSISIIVAIVSASLSYYFTKRLQMTADERRLKREYYQKYLIALNDIGINPKNIDCQNNFAKLHNTITLIGNPDVVKNVMDFHTFNIERREDSNDNKQNHDKILTNLIKSMRVDLYKKKKTNNK